MSYIDNSSTKVVRVVSEGLRGNTGWSPVLSAVLDTTPRVVHQVQDWVGGEGPKPRKGLFVSSSGLTDDISMATNIRGPAGGPPSGGGDIDEIVAEVIAQLNASPIAPNGIVANMSLLGLLGGVSYRITETQLRDYVAAIVPEPGGELPAPNPDWTGQGVFRFTAGSIEPVPGMTLIGVGNMQGIPAFGTPGAGSPTGAKVFVASLQSAPGEVTYNILFTEAASEQNNSVNTWANRTGKLVDAAGVIYWSGKFGDYGNPDNGNGAVAPNGRMLVVGTEYALVANAPTDPELGRNGVGITAVGDSITQEGRTGKWGWLAKASYFSGQSLRFRGDFAIGGTKTDSGLAVQLPQVLAMTPKPRACVVAFGSNHLSTGEVATGISELKEICDILVANDIQPILWTAPPRGNIPASRPFIESWNAQIKEYQVQTGWPLVDAWAILKDPDSYAIFPPEATYDGTHPSNFGCALIGKAAGDEMPSWNVWHDVALPLPVAGNIGSGNIAPNPLLVAGSTPGLAQDVLLEVDTKSVPTLVAATAPAAGNWQRFTLPSGVDPSGGTPGIATLNVTPGEKYTMAFRLNTNNVGTTVGNAFSATSSLYFSKENYAPVPTGSTVFLLESPGLDQEQGVIYLRDIVVPEEAAHMSLLAAGSYGLTAGNTARFAEFAQVYIQKQ